MTVRPCPVCERPAAPSFRPFCSARCKDEDLRRWLAGDYRIPSRPGLDNGDEDSAVEDESR